MTSSKENNNHEALVKELAESLHVTSTLMQSLLIEIRDHSTSLAVLKEKLSTLKINVDGLSAVVRNGNGNGSLVTRVALLERSLAQLETQLDEYQKELTEEIRLDRETNREQSLGKLKVAAVAIPGIVSLIIIIIKLLVGEGAQ